MTSEFVRCSWSARPPGALLSSGSRRTDSTEASAGPSGGARGDAGGSRRRRNRRSHGRPSVVRPSGTMAWRTELGYRYAPVTAPLPLSAPGCQPDVHPPNGYLCRPLPRGPHLSTRRCARGDGHHGDGYRTLPVPGAGGVHQRTFGPAFTLVRTFIFVTSRPVSGFAGSVPLSRRAQPGVLLPPALVPVMACIQFTSRPTLAVTFGSVERTVKAGGGGVCRPADTPAFRTGHTRRSRRSPKARLSPAPGGRSDPSGPHTAG